MSTTNELQQNFDIGSWTMVRPQPSGSPWSFGIFFFLGGGVPA